MLPGLHKDLCQIHIYPPTSSTALQHLSNVTIFFTWVDFMLCNGLCKTCLKYLQTEIPRAKLSGQAVRKFLKRVVEKIWWLEKSWGNLKRMGKLILVEMQIVEFITSSSSSKYKNCRIYNLFKFIWISKLGLEACRRLQVCSSPSDVFNYVKLLPRHGWDGDGWTGAWMKMWMFGTKFY